MARGEMKISIGDDGKSFTIGGGDEGKPIYSIGCGAGKPIYTIAGSFYRSAEEGST